MLSPDQPSIQEESKADWVSSRLSECFPLTLAELCSLLQTTTLNKTKWRVACITLVTGYQNLTELFAITVFRLNEWLLKTFWFSTLIMSGIITWELNYMYIVYCNYPVYTLKYHKRVKEFEWEQFSLCIVLIPKAVKRKPGLTWFFSCLLKD